MFFLFLKITIQSTSFRCSGKLLKTWIPGFLGQHSKDQKYGFHQQKFPQPAHRPFSFLFVIFATPAKVQCSVHFQELLNVSNTYFHQFGHTFFLFRRPSWTKSQNKTAANQKHVTIFTAARGQERSPTNRYQPTTF